MKLEDNVKIGRLIDVYGSLLTAKQLEMVTSYYFDNLSLAEIGDNYGISRQSVKCSIDQAVSALEGYEEKLKMIHKADKVVDLLRHAIIGCKDTKIVNEITSIIEEIRG